MVESATDRRVARRVADRLRRVGSERGPARLASACFEPGGTASGRHGGGRLGVLVAGRGVARLLRRQEAETPRSSRGRAGDRLRGHRRRRQVRDLGTRGRDSVLERPGRCDLPGPGVRRRGGGDPEAERGRRRDPCRLAVVSSRWREVSLLCACGRRRSRDAGRARAAAAPPAEGRVDGPVFRSRLLRLRQRGRSPRAEIRRANRAALGPSFLDGGARQLFHVDGGRRSFATSPGGTLAFQPQDDVHRLVWFDRTGRELGSVGAPGEATYDLRIPRDGRADPLRSRRDRARHVRRLVVRRRAKRRDADDVGSPDSEFSATLAAGREERRLSRPYRGRIRVWSGGTWRPAGRRRSCPRVASRLPRDVSPDGRTLVYFERPRRGSFDCGRSAARAPERRRAAPRRDSRGSSRRMPSLDSRPTAAISRSSPASPDSARPT